MIINQEEALFVSGTTPPCVLNTEKDLRKAELKT